ncbi:MAG: EAL domain-containing protein [Treponema sp.]|uniref:GGDEF domain-containing phosphodiesterase n=1 Tax=Treponema sp. TaxID=166 RepID=UPI0025DAFCB4|nr:GGDEF domain-containing phosphodiesterase [Treponema sp.]MBQ8680883.1 EAL domain-containing protein [Treponema sp.]
MKYTLRKIGLLLLCVFVNIACEKILRSFSASARQVISIGSFYIPAFALQGVFSGIRELTCILMVFIDYKIGIFFALPLILLNIGNSFVPVFTKHSLASLPGIINSLVSLIIVYIIHTFYKKAVIGSYTDFITGLENRRSFVRDATIRLSETKAFTLVCLEVEGFKETTTMFGILAGDFILKHTALKLKRLCKKNVRIFKITGAKFVLIFEESDKKIIEERVCEIIKPETVNIPSESEGGQKLENFCALSFAAGINYIHPPFTKKMNASSILKDTETAMLTARNKLDLKICEFDDSLENAEAKQKEAELLIQESLEKNYFYLVYQPQFTTNEKKLRGFEVLIRCKKPDGSIVSPVAFIPAAEKTNLIMRIDDYVIRRALTEGKILVDSTNNECIISINVSAKNIASEGFAEKVGRMIKESGFPAKNLEIEITEYSFAESEKTVANILALKDLGVQVALDDFGTGYTSIAQLMKLPINLLKIDKSLIDDIETNQTMRDMVDSVIYMGHIMNCEVISEGVENENQIALLKEHKCDFIQGFVWGRPQSYEDAENLCRTNS